jgi:DNA invertase Pin-like site-specific DNA recombinase
VTLTEPATLRAGVYARISSDDRRDELGVKRQEHNCRLLAEAKGWEITDVYADNDRSASKEITKRPEYDRLVGDVAARRIDVVLVQNQERLVRKPDELEQLMRSLRRAGHGSFWTVTAGEVRIDNTNGRTMARVKGVFDIGYAEFISEKVREKKDELAEKGLPAGGGTRPFGYDVDKVTVRAAEAKLIREAASRILAGATLNAVVKDWNQRDVTTVTGAVWTPNVLRLILSSPRVAGLRSHRGEVVGQAAWPAILKRDQWDALVRLFAERTGRPTDSTNRRLLTGLLVCGRCGQPMWAGMNNGKPTYACVRREGRPGCFLSIDGGQLEDLIVAAVLRRFDDAHIPVGEAEGNHGDYVAQLQTERDELAAMKARGELTMDEWKTLRAGVLERLDRARATLQADMATAERAERIGRYRKPGALRKAWPRVTMPERREILRAVIDTITVTPARRGRNRFDPDRIEVRWRA